MNFLDVIAHLEDLAEAVVAWPHCFQFIFDLMVDLRRRKLLDAVLIIC